MTSHPPLDAIDVRLLEALDADPRTPVVELARRLGVARGTAQARLDRLQRTGVLRGLGPQVDPAAVGHPVTAFLTCELRQGAGRDRVREHLAAIPEVLEVHTTTGDGDLLVRVVARSNSDLQRVVDAVVADPSVMRTSTVIALREEVAHRVLPLVRSASVRSATADG